MSRRKLSLITILSVLALSMTFVAVDNETTSKPPCFCIEDIW